MKSKSCIAALLLAVFTLGLTTSCEDMFDIDSNRVVYNHELNSTADSAYTTLGILKCLQKVAERYVILGEVRGDMCDINENTKPSLRNLANFSFDDDNEYLNVRDYYAIINNCNYALANMDTTLKLSNKLVMMDEYAALIGIRAWTYLQLAINYDSVYYYTEPMISESDVNKVRLEGKKDVKTIAADLSPQLALYLDYALPSFAETQGEYPILRLVLADLYLWSGDYENAVKCYEDFFMNNKKHSFKVANALQPGYMNLGGYFQEWKDPNEKIVKSLSSYVEENGVSEDYSSSSGVENFSNIRSTSSLSSLFKSPDNTHYLNPSASWHSLSAKQMVFKHMHLSTEKKDSLYRTSLLGDMRKYRYYNSAVHDEEEFGHYDKFAGNVNIYRRTLACLRWAEAMNALAMVQYDGDKKSSEARSNAENAFYLLKDASRVFFPDSSDVMKKFETAADKEEQWRNPFIGVHGRGCGDVRYDTTYYVLKPAVIANRLGKEVADVNFNDTIEYIDELIIDELALESTLEGNRFGDLIRFAERRNDVDVLAKRVAARKGQDNFDVELYDKLTDKANWYLPFK